jgi:leucyl aminopeptidase (aminopeptidase T)
MPDPAAVRKDAELVVDVCMSVEKDDVVTIITDDEHLDQARVVAEVCVDRGAWPVIANNEMQVRRGRADTLFPMAPPRNLHQAMVSSDEIIIITNLEWANRFAHVSAVKESCANNAKIASVEPGMGEWGLTVEGLHRAQQRAWDAMAALEGVEKVRVTSAKGTDFTVTIKDRPALEVTSIKKRGQMMGPLPLWAEVAWAAVEDGTDGTVVVDGVMLGIGLPGQVTEPITWTVEKGKAVKIEGGDDARRLREVLEGVENATVVGEFAFGVSEVAPFGTPSEKGRVGTVHLALGDNHNAYPGGQNVSVLHLDGVVLDASMQIVDNGRWILREGEWVL